MTHDPREDAERRWVRRRVRGLRHHVLVYLCVMAGLVIVATVGGRTGWVIWPAVGWGVAILIHAASVFGFDIGREWEDRLVDHLMARRRRQIPPPTVDPPPPPL